MKKGFLLLLLCFLVSRVYASDFQFPLLQSFSAFPLKNTDLRSAKSEFYLLIREANSFSYNPTNKYFNDFELTSFNLIYQEKISGSSSFYAQLSYQLYWGGMLDKFIEKFHSSFGFPSAGREKYPRNAVNYFFRDYFKYEERVRHFAPLLLMVSSRLIDSADLDLCLHTGVSIPLSRKPGFASSRMALLLGAKGTISFKNGDFSVEQFFSFFKRPDWLSEEELRFYISSTSLMLNLKKAVFALTMRTSPFTDTEAASSGICLKIGYAVSPHLEIGLEEDLPPFDTTFDIAFYLRWRII